MQVRFGLLAIMLATAFGCAAPEQKQAGAAAPAAAAQPSRSSGDYRTGSRLPALEDDRGPGAVSGQSKQDFMDDMNRTNSPGRSN